MQFQSSVINNEEIKIIHEQSIRILEEVGVKVPSEKVLAMLEEGGARIDWDARVALISREMVEEALGKAPKEFILGARNPVFDMRLSPEGAMVGDMPGPFINMDGCGSHVIDFETGERRPGVLQDLRYAGKIFDAIPEAQVLWSTIMPDDVPANAAGVVSAATSMLASGKHLMDEVQNVREWPFFLELLKAFAGDEQEIKARKIYGACYCTVAPLCHDGEMLEGTLELAKVHGPILMYPMPCSGSTGPASLQSNIAMANAETLSSLVIFQLASPGTPLIYGAALGRMNVRTGFFSLGAVETALQMAGMNQMGKYYGFPTMCTGGVSDANVPGEQALMEKVLTTMSVVLTGCDIIQGLGLIEGSMTLSLEQMLVDAEMFRQCRRMYAGIDMSGEKDYFEDIKSAGPGGDFLRCKTTRKAFRTDEFYNPQLVPWQAYDRWVKDGSKNMYMLAHEQAEQILEAEPVSPVDSNTEKLVLEIIEEARAKL